MSRAARCLVAGLALVLLAGCGSTGRTPAAAPAKDEPVTVGDGPVGVAAGPGGDVWVASAGANTVSRIPPGANKADLRVAVTVPLRVTVAYGAVWATSFQDGTLVRIDPASGKVTDRIPIGKGAEGVTSAFGAIWAVAQDDGLLARVDPATHKVVRRIHVGVGVRLVKAGGGALYLNDFPGNGLVRVDPATAKVRRGSQLCPGPQDMVVVGRTVWLTCSVSNELVTVDTTSLKVTGHLHVDGTPDAITAGPGGELLVVAQQGPSLVSVDPAARKVTHTTVLGHQPQLYDRANLDLTVTHGTVWVTSFTDGKVFRVAANR